MTMNVPLRFLFISNAALRANASAATSSAGSPLEMVPFVDQATQPNHWEEVSEMALSGAHRLGDATTTTLFDTGVKLSRL